ncbi:MAG: alpha/beta hydrolase [Clostridia bacterium]|nr:alpha/beta hydrolase [Clostridia bacterium]
MFFHGYLSSKEAFSEQIEYFSRFFRVTAFDFLGFGNSAFLEEPFSVADYAVWTDAFLKAVGVERAHLIAHSFGCRVAVKMAAADKNTFDKMLLTGPAGVIMNRGIRYRCKVKLYRAVKKLAPRFAERRFGSAEYRTLSPVMKESYKKIVNEDLRETARKVENEVLIAEGREDTTTPLKEAQAYLSCFRRGKLKLLDGGHFAFAEYPTQFDLIAEEFFNDG